MPPYAEMIQERTAVIVLNRCLEFRERNALIRACLGWSQPPPCTVVLDLSRLERVNVVTISAILRLRELLDGMGRSCSLRGCSPAVHEALEYLGLHRLMRIEG